MHGSRATFGRHSQISPAIPAWRGRNAIVTHSGAMPGWVFSFLPNDEPRDPARSLARAVGGVVLGFPRPTAVNRAWLPVEAGFQVPPSRKGLMN